MTKLQEWPLLKEQKKNEIIKKNELFYEQLNQFRIARNHLDGEYTRARKIKERAIYYHNVIIQELKDVKIRSNVIKQEISKNQEIVDLLRVYNDFFT